MARFVLTHVVHRSHGPANEYQLESDNEDVFILADVAADFSTVTPWQQEIVDLESDQHWYRGVTKPTLMGTGSQWARIGDSAN